MREELFAASGLTAALAASMCCVLPVSLAAVGLGGTWLSTLAIPAPYQVALRVLAIVALGAGFWLAYWGRPATANGTARPAGATRIALWTGAALMALVIGFGWWERLAA